MIQGLSILCLFIAGVLATSPPRRRPPVANGERQTVSVNQCGRGIKTVDCCNRLCGGSNNVLEAIEIGFNEIVGVDSSVRAQCACGYSGHGGGFPEPPEPEIIVEPTYPYGGSNNGQWPEPEKIVEPMHPRGGRNNGYRNNGKPWISPEGRK